MNPSGTFSFSSGSLGKIRGGCAAPWRKVRSWRLSFAEGIEGLDLCPKGGKGHGCFAYVLPTCYWIARFVGRELCGAREKDQAFRSSRCSRKGGCSSKPASDHSRL